MNLSGSGRVSAYFAAKMNHSPIAFLVFSLFFYSHLNTVFDTLEHQPIGILERERLLAGTDKCVLAYLRRRIGDGEKAFNVLPFIVKRCALSQYFPLEEYGSARNATSSIRNLFPLFQHPHLRKCHSFLFFGTSSFEMAPELEILTSVDFQLFDCKYLIVDKRNNRNGLRHFIQVPEMTETYLNDILMQYKDDKDFVIEHLFIFEMAKIDNFAIEKILELRKLYLVLPCQITIRFPKSVEKRRLWAFAEQVLRNEQYILMDVRILENYFELFSQFLIQIERKTVDEEILYQSAKENLRCLQQKLAFLNDNQTYHFIVPIVNECTFRKNLRLKRYENNDEFKYFWAPTRPPQQTKACTIVTLGVGKDVQAERKLKTEHPGCRLVGADPVRHVNELLFREIGGEFHRIAVGTRNGNMTSLVLRGGGYSVETVESLDLPTFIVEKVGSTTIDALLVDVEYGEFELFPYFRRGSELEKRGITVCQVNVEVHDPKVDGERKAKFAEFVRRMVEDGHFHLLEASEFRNNRRLYFTRVDRKRCS